MFLFLLLLLISLITFFLFNCKKWFRKKAFWTLAISVIAISIYTKYFSGYFIEIGLDYSSVYLGSDTKLSNTEFGTVLDKGLEQIFLPELIYIDSETSALYFKKDEALRKINFKNNLIAEDSDDSMPNAFQPTWQYVVEASKKFDYWCTGVYCVVLVCFIISNKLSYNKNVSLK